MVYEMVDCELLPIAKFSSEAKNQCYVKICTSENIPFYSRSVFNI